jgi:predicted helicase
VIIGNPPYNANQLNENENNKNREYPGIDKRIKETYIKNSTAQKTKLYDMYTRFIRWASDRLDKNGVIAFVSNNSFLNARSYDGFRKVVTNEFNEIYIIDLKGDARTSGEQRRKEGGNVFSDQIRVGVAVYFLVRRQGEKGCHIHYNAIADYANAEEKQAYLRDNKFTDLKFQPIHPDKNYNWINLVENDWDEFISTASKAAKSEKGTKEPKTIFKLFSLGVVTARDEWVYDERKDNLNRKVNFLIDIYNTEVDKYFGKVQRSEISDRLDYSIKWTRAVKNDLIKGRKYSFEPRHIVSSTYRPFIRREMYFNRSLNEMQYQLPKVFAGDNVVITHSGTSASKPFSALVVNDIFSYDLLEKTESLPFYRYTNNGERVENITDWALAQFQKHYGKGGSRSAPTKPIGKLDIFHYVYAVLHHPSYRTKYEQNLKREFPRIPFYEDFWKWTEWGKRLMELHLNYEKVEAYPLERVESQTSNVERITPSVTRLMARKETGIIEVDTVTSLRGVPSVAWEYRLGTYSALEWVLERYKEKKPKDPTIAEKFNTYKFADYKESVIALLGRVCAVSVKTMEIVREMPE